MNRRLAAALALVALLAPMPARADVLSYGKTVYPQTTISTAGTTVGEVISLGQVPGTQTISVEAIFLYGSGGTSAKAYVQTSLDNGATWIDVMSFAFTTAAASKVSQVNIYTAVAAAVTPTDGTLTDNTILSGVLGDRLRVKVITTGTYGGATSIKVALVQR
jgi:hypothetical protein